MLKCSKLAVSKEDEKSTTQIETSLISWTYDFIITLMIICCMFASFNFPTLLKYNLQSKLVFGKSKSYDDSNAWYHCELQFCWFVHNIHLFYSFIVFVLLMADLKKTLRFVEKYWYF